MNQKVKGVVTKVLYAQIEVNFQGKMITFQKESHAEYVVGDQVLLSEKLDCIEKRMDRKNTIFRYKKDRTKHTTEKKVQIIATNIDLALIVVSCGNPPLHPKFIDRYTIILKKNKIPICLVFNKCDLETEKEKDIFLTYQKLGFDCIKTSVVQKKGLIDLKEKMKDQQVILVGHSGVGKSSLIKNLIENEEIKTNCVSQKSQKGTHTTTTKTGYVIDNTIIIDTPGIKSLEMIDLDPIELQTFFPEFQKFAPLCCYPNCLHDKETTEKCGVKKAIQKEKSFLGRYQSYLKLLHEIQKLQEK